MRSVGLLAVGTMLLAGCAGAPSTLDTRGPQAARIVDLWWLMFGLAMAVFALVVGLLAVALFRRRAVPSADDERRRGVPAEQRGGRLGRFAAHALVVGGGIVLPIVILVPLTILTFRDVMLAALPGREPTLTVEVTGRQFWWEIRYPEYQIVTANEIHIPVGEPVRLVLRTGDVIHSFWIPQLMGKLDMTPGREDETWVQADQPGVYWGQCTELCGLQHARMAFVVVAVERDAFDTWTEAQRHPAVEPADPLARQGAQVFAREGCIACHTVRYGQATAASGVGGQSGVPGPDLTHVASRRTLAAGTLENNRGNLGGWIANPQALKPGNLMPVVPLDGESLLALVAYLESLK